MPSEWKTKIWMNRRKPIRDESERNGRTVDGKRRILIGNLKISMTLENGCIHLQKQAAKMLLYSSST